MTNLGNDVLMRSVLKKLPGKFSASRQMPSFSLCRFPAYKRLWHGTESSFLSYPLRCAQIVLLLCYLTHYSVFDIHSIFLLFRIAKYCIAWVQVPGVRVSLRARNS